LQFVRRFLIRIRQAGDNQVVTIKRTDKIVEVGPADRSEIPASAEVIDLSHATVLPGLMMPTPTCLQMAMIWKCNFCGIRTTTGTLIALSNAIRI